MIDHSMQQNLHIPSVKAIEIVSVSDFFEQINWYGKNLSDTHDLTLENTPYETVGQFFSTFPWRGTTNQLMSDNIATESDNDVFELENDTLTLEDLSALF